MRLVEWHRIAVAVGLLVTGGGLASTPPPVSATEIPDLFVVAESAVPYDNTLLEDAIGSDRAPQERHDTRSAMSERPAQDRPLTTPIIVRPDVRPGQRLNVLQEELKMPEVLAPGPGLAAATPSIVLEYGERRLEVPLALPAPFIFDPAHGILVFDVRTLTPMETYAFASVLVTVTEPLSRPLPPLNTPGPSLNGGPDAFAGLLGFIKLLMVNPDLGFIAVIGPALAALGLVRRFRSEKPKRTTRPETGMSSTSTSSGQALMSATQAPSDDRVQAPPGTMEPECTEKLPARRSAA